MLARQVVRQRVAVVAARRKTRPDQNSCMRSAFQNSRCFPISSTAAVLRGPVTGRRCWCSVVTAMPSSSHFGSCRCASAACVISCAITGSTHREVVEHGDEMRAARSSRTRRSNERELALVRVVVRHVVVVLDPAWSSTTRMLRLARRKLRDAVEQLRDPSARGRHVAAAAFATFGSYDDSTHASSVSTRWALSPSLSRRCSSQARRPRSIALRR